MHAALFLAFQVTDLYQEQLDKISSSERDPFIQKQALNQKMLFREEENLCLQEFENEGIKYLGKYLGPSTDMEKLTLSSLHLYSLLKKWAPSFPYDDHPLLLIALPLEITNE